MDLNLANLNSLVEDKAPAPAAEDIVGKDLEFEVQYRDPETGKFLVGQFVSRVPNASSKSRAGRIMAELAGNYRFDVMPEHWKVWALSVASCATQLVTKPKWFDEKAGEDDNLLFAVQGRLEDHAERYFRSAPSASEGEAERPSVVIRTAADRQAASSSK